MDDLGIVQSYNVYRGRQSVNEIPDLVQISKYRPTKEIEKYIRGSFTAPYDTSLVQTKRYAAFEKSDTFSVIDRVP